MRFVLNSANFTAKFALLLEVILNLELKFIHTGRKIATSHNQNQHKNTPKSAQKSHNVRRVQDR